MECDCIYLTTLQASLSNLEAAGAHAASRALTPKKASGRKTLQIKSLKKNTACTLHMPSSATRLKQQGLKQGTKDDSFLLAACGSEQGQNFRKMI